MLITPPPGANTGAVNRQLTGGNFTGASTTVPGPQFQAYNVRSPFGQSQGGIDTGNLNPMPQSQSPSTLPAPNPPVGTHGNLPVPGGFTPTAMGMGNYAGQVAPPFASGGTNPNALMARALSGGGGQ